MRECLTHTLELSPEGCAMIVFVFVFAFAFVASALVLLALL